MFVDPYRPLANMYWASTVCQARARHWGKSSERDAEHQQHTVHFLSAFLLGRFFMHMILSSQPSCKVGRTSIIKTLMVMIVICAILSIFLAFCFLSSIFLSSAMWHALANEIWGGRIMSPINRGSKRTFPFTLLWWSWMLTCPSSAAWATRGSRDPCCPTLDMECEGAIKLLLH